MASCGCGIWLGLVVARRRSWGGRALVTGEAVPKTERVYRWLCEYLGMACPYRDAVEALPLL